MRRHRLLMPWAGLMGLTLSLAACGSSGSTSNTGGGSTTTTSTPSTTTSTSGATGPTGSTTVAAASMASARAALLTLTDMPASWTSTKASGGQRGLDHQQALQMAQCLGVPATDVSYNPPEVDSPEFDGPGGFPSIDDGILVFPSVALAQHQFSILTNSQTPQCFAQVLTSSEAQLFKSLPAGSTVGTISVTPLTDFGTLGDGAVALLVRIPLTTQGQQLHLALVVADVLHGSYGITLEATNLTAPVATDFVRNLVQLNISRLP